jgi:hypothetical protein
MPPRELTATREDLAGLVRHAASHRFDLLGSGPVTVAHGVECRGLEGVRFSGGKPVAADADGRWLAALVGRTNAVEAARIWRLVQPPYLPIDWQLDFKSGFRWSERTWFRDVEFGGTPGADVKVPWELARMQHLPQLALADSAVFAREFRNQVLDFIAANPPRFGANWVTAMDVAIRVANWLVAYDLFRAGGVIFDDGFELVFRRSVLEHGRHIAANLEWSEVRGNHYLADLAGLLFVAAYLPGSAETTGWCEFARSELFCELRMQFHAEGSNVEASTSYHRLSAEMATYAVALLIRLGGAGSIPDDIVSRSAGMASFVIDLTKPDGRMPQIGDNDSGRFITLGPVCDETSELDHRSLVGAINGLFGRAELEAFARGAGLETALVASLAGGVRLAAATPVRPSTIATDVDAGAVEQWIAARPPQHRCSLRIALPAEVLAGAGTVAYPAFGLYAVRGPRIYVAVRCGSLAASAPRGHAHNDQLSIELQVDGQDWIRDPGTYVYTPMPARRNAYRSMHAHFGPRFDGAEPARLDTGPFELPRADARCMYWGSLGFAGKLRTADGRVVMARVRVEASSVDIDWAAEGALLAGRALDDGDWQAYRTDLPFSPGYGRLETGGSA